MIDEKKSDMNLENKIILKSQIIENKNNINNIDENYNETIKIQEIDEENKIEEKETIKIDDYNYKNVINEEKIIQEEKINNEFDKNSEKFVNLELIIKNNILKNSVVNKKLKDLSNNSIKNNFVNNLNINTKSFQKKKLFKEKLNNELNEIQNKIKEKKKLEINMNIKNPLTTKINDKLVKNKNFFSRQEEYIKKVEEKKNKIELELKKKENEEMKKAIKKKWEENNFEKFLSEMKEKEEKKNEKIERLKKLNEEKIQKEIDEINYNSINNFHLSNEEINESINWLYKEDVKQRKRNKEIMNEIFKPNFTPKINQNNLKFIKNKKNYENEKTLKKKELIDNFFNTLINKNNKQDINDEFIFNYINQGKINDLNFKNNRNLFQKELEIIEEEDEN